MHTVFGLADAQNCAPLFACPRFNSAACQNHDPAAHRHAFARSSSWRIPAANAEIAGWHHDVHARADAWTTPRNCHRAFDDGHIETGGGADPRVVHCGEIPSRRARPEGVEGKLLLLTHGMVC